MATVLPLLQDAVSVCLHGVESMSEGMEGSGLSSMGLLRETPGGRKGLARVRARRDGGGGKLGSGRVEGRMWYNTVSKTASRTMSMKTSDMNYWLTNSWLDSTQDEDVFSTVCSH